MITSFFSLGGNITGSSQPTYEKNERGQDRRFSPFIRLLFTLACCRATHFAFLDILFSWLSLHYCFTPISHQWAYYCFLHMRITYAESTCMNYASAMLTDTTHGRLHRSFTFGYIEVQYCLRYYLQWHHFPSF